MGHNHLTRGIRISALFVMAALLFVACANATPTIISTLPPTAIPEPTNTLTYTNTPNPTNTPSPTSTHTLEPTSTPTLTRTPFPTKTPMSELLPENVDLPVGEEITQLIYKYCYVFADDNNDNQLDRFHAGDLIYFYTNFSGVDNGIEYTVLAPVEGKVIYSQLINDSIGWEIRIETPYVFNGERVYYDIVHADRPAQGIREGVFVEKGQPILIVSTLRNNGRFEKAIDIGFRNGPRGPNPNIQDMFYPYSYMAVSTFFVDDFERLKSAGIIINFETCDGNPVPPGVPMNP